MISAGDVQAMLADFGRTVTLRRIGTPPVDVVCLAMITEKDDAIGAGGVTQTRRQVTIGNSEIAAAGWPGPPHKGDQIIDDGRTMTVQAVLVQKIGAEVVMHRMETLGG